ncbi:MAG: endo-1,4-beta-xylanase [Armatimonadota bacterium]
MINNNVKIYTKVFLFIFLLLIPSILIAQTMNASSFVFKSVGSVHDTNGWKLNREGYIGTFINLTQESEVYINVRAIGQMAQNVNPVMNVCIADKKFSYNVYSVTSPPFTSYQNHYSNFYLKPGTYPVRIEFVNDYTTVGDRNLYIKSVSFSGSGLSIINNPTNITVFDAADTYIEHYRKGDAIVNILDSQGNPVAGNVNVHIKLKRHAFNFGTEVYGCGGDFYPPTWAKPNPPVGSDYYKYQEFIKNNFNMIVPGNAGKWAYHEAERGVLTLDDMDLILDFADAHNLKKRMHGVIWDFDFQQPDWVNTLVDEAKTDSAKKQELREAISNRIDYMVADRAHRWSDIDVVNEPVHTGDYFNIFGYEGLADIFNESSQKANGKALGFINEWGVIQVFGYNPNEYNNWYRDHIQNIINFGGAVEGVGIQYYTRPDIHDPIVIHRCLQNFMTLGLPIKLTEFGVDKNYTGQTAANILTDTIKLIFGNAQIDTFNLWGFWKPWIWQEMNGAALVDENWNLTEAGIAYQNLMNHWHTEGDYLTDIGGSIYFNGFYGIYDVIINDLPYTINLEKDLFEYDIQLVDVTTIAQEMLMPDNTSIGIKNAVITALYPYEGYLYIQDESNPFGIRVNYNGGMFKLYDKVNLTGTISTRTQGGKERVIIDPTIIKVSSNNYIKPIGMKTLDVGGSSIPDFAVEDANGKLGIGPCNIGLLVKISGRVTAVENDYIWVNDGSDIPDASGNLGVMVKMPAGVDVEVNNFIGVTGVIEGNLPDGKNLNRRYIRARTADDIILY